jgi:hypothetical protein
MKLMIFKVIYIFFRFLVRRFGGEVKFIRPQQKFYRAFIDSEGIKVW